jgi:alpha-galactosidase
MSVGKIGVISVVVALSVVNTFAADKPIEGAQGRPLKVFIMAGQSNMEGKAQVKTIARLNMTDDARQMYQDMNVKDGLPSAAEDVYGVYFNGGDMHRGQQRPVSVQKGPLKPGFGSEMTESTTFGPEYTFAIYMHKHLQSPILIIKTAWGGRDLIQQFRSPSAGKYAKDEDRFGNPTGYYYGQIIKHVKEVLADPGQYYPAYSKNAGYEIAGFVWFQGYNDLVGPYPGDKGGKDYSEYSRLMACFIRDMRKDLEAPKMPFVIGVMGIGGPIEDEQNGQFGFRKAQETPAALPEFKGNVAAVRTEHYWDMELVRIQNKVADAAKKKVLAENPKLGGKALSEAIGKAAKSMAPEVLTPEELKITQTGTSNAAYHYMGSAYTYGMIGKAFAEAMAKMMK